MYLKVFPFGPFETNAILFACAETLKAAVIDPSMGSTKSILKEARAHNFSIEKILLTHSHWDHTADVYELKNATGAEVYVHSLDAANLEQPGSDGLPLAFEIKEVKAEHLLKDKLTVGKLRITVMHTPGHSPGSVCFYLPDEKILFSGDTLFKGTYGAVHFPTSQPKSMIASLKKLSTLPPETRVIPGHGRETTIEQEIKMIRSMNLS